VAIVADDLTGALDAAAPFAGRGAGTRVVVALEHLEALLDAWRGSLPEVIAVNTESRHLDASVAAERVTLATALLSRISPEVWFKKIDSTLRGQVVAECLAMREACERRLLLAPAVPAQGRILRDAEVRVEGVPLASTAYGGDARSAPPLGPLDEVFARHGLPLSRYPARSDDGLPGTDCVADAESDHDLDRLQEASRSDAADWLMVGAAGLAAAIARHLFGQPRPSLRIPLETRSRVYAVGSRSPLAVAQVNRLSHAEPTLTIVEALETSLSAPTVRPDLVIPGGPPHQAHDAEEVAKAMAMRVEAAVGQWPPGPGLLFLTGGDIAMEVLSRLGVTFIQVDAEWSPGVATGFLEGDRQRWVMTKAGGFGHPNLLVELEACLGSPDTGPTESRQNGNGYGAKERARDSIGGLSPRMVALSGTKR
jgi:uncharacterized protein YgbK (DUF1537 family)